MNKVNGVRVAGRRHSVIRQSWFRLLSEAQSRAFAIGRGEQPKKLAQPSLFEALPERHTDDG